MKRLGGLAGHDGNPRPNPLFVRLVVPRGKRPCGPRRPGEPQEARAVTFRARSVMEDRWTRGYGHDGRSSNLAEVILRHGGDAQAQRDAFAILSDTQQRSLLEFLNSLILFPPDDTASNLKPADRNAPNFPQNGHGSISLTAAQSDSFFLRLSSRFAFFARCTAFAPPCSRPLFPRCVPSF